MIITPDDGDSVVIQTGKHAKMFLEGKQSIQEMDTDDVTSGAGKAVQGGVGGKRKKPDDKSSLNQDNCDLAGAKKVIDDYIESNHTGSIEISNISKEDRHKLHIYAAIKGLDHWSDGIGSARVMFVQKK